MTPTVTIRGQGFRQMCTELARMSGREYRDVLRSEAGSVIKIAALESPIASKAQIEKQVQEREGHSWETDLGEWSSNVRTNEGRLWFWDKDKGVDRAVLAHGPLLPGAKREVVQRGGFYMVFDAGPSRGHHVPDAIWLDYLDSRYLRQKIVAARIKELLGRRGMERLSWLQMADAMEVNLAEVAPAGSLRENIARGATVRGRTYKNGSAFESTDFFRFKITVENQSPVAIKRWGQRRIQNAMGRRRRGFDFAMKKGLFDNLTLRAKRYPGIFIKPA